MKTTSIFGVFALLGKGKPPIDEDAPTAPVTTGGDDGEASGKAILEKPKVTVISANGSLKVYVRGIEYNLRVTKPAHGVGVSELKRSLDRNREMLGQSFDSMVEIYQAYCLNPDPFVEYNEGAFRTATKNALVARANIDVLIPLINIRGGDAEYCGAGEGLPIEQHVESLRKRAEKLVDDELGVELEEEPTGEVEWQSVFIAGVVVVLVVMLLKVFL